MRSIVISALFEALPALGYPCIRFNFRGVEGSEGSYAEGRDEPLDIVAAIDAVAAEMPGPPIVLAAWSFGADMALQVVDHARRRVGRRSRHRCDFDQHSRPRATRVRST